MAVQANWFLGDLDGVEEPDPLGPAQTRIEDVGTPIDLAGDHAKLNALLVTTLSEEQALFEAGITCAVKDNAQTCCSACPIRRSDDLEPLTALCKVGVRQERLVTLTFIAREQPDSLPIPRAR